MNYNFIKKIKNEFPQINFILNGGIQSIEEAHLLSKEYDGVMLGRLIQNNPFSLMNVDELFFNIKQNKTITEKIIVDYFSYIKSKTNKTKSKTKTID